ncbi:MAG TPA: cytochrome c family protein, partial [Xanthobacteraceae bacterium]|nr:cytochrome c family protein [Xanthobacteraceae bacterium]
RSHALGRTAPGARPGPGTGGVRFVMLLAFTVALAAATAAGTPLKGDPARGEEIYARCGACHALESNRTGPRHCGLFGRRAGSVPGFDYSAAMKGSGITWDARSLDRFLANPLATVPGTAMTYAGVPDAQERADLIAYLRIATAQCAK